MAIQSFSLDGVAIKYTPNFKIERYLVTTLERLANADMAGDLIARKKKFYFTYSEITSTDLDTILGILFDSNSLFHTLAYVENNVSRTATVYVGSIPSDLYRTGSVWIWQNVTFNLIEK